MATISSSPVTVTLTTSNISATAGSDYTAASNVLLTILPNTTSVSHSLAIQQDSLIEGHETFRVTLSNPTGTTLDRSEGTVTILDDEPIVSVANAT